MSQPIKRYRITGYESVSGKGCTQEDVCPDGDWVDWKDYAALAAENERLIRLLLDLSDAVHFHRANADTAKCSATIDRIVAEVDKMHPIS